MSGLIDRYRERLPFAPGDPVVSLGEGSTPLIEAPRLSERARTEVWLKIEGANPTGSFKDRGMTCAVSAAVREGARAVICASTGNTAASAAAYAARAGLRGAVIVPEGKIAAGKLAQAIVHGAQVIMVRGNFDDCLRISRELAEHYPVALVNSVNPFRLEGQKTASFEIVDFLGDAPDVHVLPVGNAGNISAYWKGYVEYAEAGLATRRPMMLGWQAEGAAPLVLGEPVAAPETVASAIRIGNPASWHLAVEAARTSGGAFGSVSDEEILAAQRALASTEGIFVEPGSAASVAGLLKDTAAGRDLRGKRVVVTVTGHGLKDIDTALST
ncbi:MAG: threonine synthase, partial [Acidimicrobiia bacterium]|nr:threonine synthase [Acidimicrobiia bacterium]